MHFLPHFIHLMAEGILLFRKSDWAACIPHWKDTLPSKMKTANRNHSHIECRIFQVNYDHLTNTDHDVALQMYLITYGEAPPVSKLYTVFSNKITCTAVFKYFLQFLWLFPKGKVWIFTRNWVLLTLLLLALTQGKQKCHCWCWYAIIAPGNTCHTSALWQSWDEGVLNEPSV